MVNIVDAKLKRMIEIKAKKSLLFNYGYLYHMTELCHKEFKRSRLGGLVPPQELLGFTMTGMLKFMDRREPARSHFIIPKYCGVRSNSTVALPREKHPAWKFTKTYGKIWVSVYFEEYNTCRYYNVVRWRKKEPGTYISVNMDESRDILNTLFSTWPGDWDKVRRSLMSRGLYV